MKAKTVLIALFVVLALVFGACSNPAGIIEEEIILEPEDDGTLTYTGTRNGVIYTLVITGDAYILTVTRGNTEKISSGTVVSFSGNIYTLQPLWENSPRIWVTVRGDRIIRITIRITFDDGTSEQGPGSLNGNNGSSSGDNNNQGGNNNQTPTYGISFTPATPYTFPALGVGYDTNDLTPINVRINNTGNQATGQLNIASSLSGLNADSFTLTAAPATIASISPGSNAPNAFTVVPNHGLPVGTYTATVTVTGGHGINASFNVSFTVNPAVINDEGSLRKAIEDAGDGEIIFLTPPGPIYLDEPLRIVNKPNLTIEGNGMALIPNWTATFPPNNATPIVDITNSTVTIRRVHFNGGSTSLDSGAINNRGNHTNILTLESCIFSVNEAISGSDHGSGIYNEGTLNVRGCTFYNNSGYMSNSAPIYNHGGILNLIGNLFYGNTVFSGDAVAVHNFNSVMLGGIINSSFNVVDAPIIIGNAGWDFVTGSGDATFNTDGGDWEDLGISGDPFNLITFEPVERLRSVIQTSPSPFPATDFYGNNRTWPGAPGAVR